MKEYVRLVCTGPLYLRERCGSRKFVLIVVICNYTADSPRIPATNLPPATVSGELVGNYIFIHYIFYMFSLQEQIE